MKAILTVFMALLLAACAGEDSQRPYVSSGTSNLPSSASTAALGQGTTTLQPSLLPGEIAGDLIYPGGKHPEMLIYAIRTDTEKPSAFVDHMWARDEAMPIPEPFGITVVPGTYHVVAYTVAGSTGPHIGAMGAVRCSGEPVCQPNWVMTAVTVRASELVNHVEIKEWNPPREAVPPEPRLDQYATFPPAAWPTTDLPAFRNPADAAVFGMG